MTDSNDERALDAGQRLKGFGLHLLGYFVAMLIIVPVNLYIYDSSIWFVLPMVGWGSVLAVHAAYVMGLFGGKA